MEVISNTPQRKGGDKESSKAKKEQEKVNKSELPVCCGEKEQRKTEVMGARDTTKTTALLRFLNLAITSIIKEHRY